MAAKKRSAPRPPGNAKATPPGASAAAAARPWDPAAVPPAEASPLADKERAFHATHFTADPRGKGKPGPAAAARSKRRRGGAR